DPERLEDALQAVKGGREWRGLVRMPIWLDTTSTYPPSADAFGAAITDNHSVYGRLNGIATTNSTNGFWNAATFGGVPAARGTGTDTAITATCYTSRSGAGFGDADATAMSGAGDVGGGAKPSQSVCRDVGGAAATKAGRSLVRRRTGAAAGADDDEGFMPMLVRGGGCSVAVSSGPGGGGTDGSSASALASRMRPPLMLRSLELPPPSPSEWSIMAIDSGGGGGGGGACSRSGSVTSSVRQQPMYVLAAAPGASHNQLPCLQQNQPLQPMGLRVGFSDNRTRFTEGSAVRAASSSRFNTLGVFAAAVAAAAATSISATAAEAAVAATFAAAAVLSQPASPEAVAGQRQPDDPGQHPMCPTDSGGGGGGADGGSVSRPCSSLVPSPAVVLLSRASSPAATESPYTWPVGAPSSTTCTTQVQLELDAAPSGVTEVPEHETTTPWQPARAGNEAWMCPREDDACPDRAPAAAASCGTSAGGDAAAAAAAPAVNSCSEESSTAHVAAVTRSVDGKSWLPAAPTVMWCRQGGSPRASTDVANAITNDTSLMPPQVAAAAANRRRLRQSLQKACGDVSQEVSLVLPKQHLLVAEELPVHQQRVPFGGGGGGGGGCGGSSSGGLCGSASEGQLHLDTASVAAVAPSKLTTSPEAFMESASLGTVTPDTAPSPASNQSPWSLRATTNSSAVAAAAPAGRDAGLSLTFTAGSHTSDRSRESADSFPSLQPAATGVSQLRFGSVLFQLSPINGDVTLTDASAAVAPAVAAAAVGPVAPLSRNIRSQSDDGVTHSSSCCGDNGVSCGTNRKDAGGGVNGRDGSDASNKPGGCNATDAATAATAPKVLMSSFGNDDNSGVADVASSELSTAVAPKPDSSLTLTLNFPRMSILGDGSDVAATATAAVSATAASVVATAAAAAAADGGDCNGVGGPGLVSDLHLGSFVRHRSQPMDSKVVAAVGGDCSGGGGGGGGSCGSDCLGEQNMRIRPAGDEDGSNGLSNGTPPPPFPCASGSLMSGCKGGVGPSGRPKQWLRVEEEKQDGGGGGDGG
ncbi:hypothetical protein Vretifemale_11024, partial [Volvox reticuliferus]